jgi:hypothetical protein
LLVWLFAAGSGWTGLLADGDTGWHIRTGEFILDAGSVPNRDPFSFSRPGEPWFAWEWLADIIFAIFHSQWGLPGVVVLAGMLIALTALVVFRHMLWRGANLFVALVVALLCVGASSIHYLARPHVFSLLLLAISLWLLDRDRRTCGKAVWCLVPLTALWVNLHGGFLALMASVGLLAAGCGIEAWLDQDRRQVHWSSFCRYCGLLTACGAASLVNPYGIRLHLHMVQYLRSDWIRTAVDEFQSPKFRSENLLHFELLLLTGLLVAGALLARRRVSDALPILVWAHLSLSSVRHVPIFAIVSAPLVASGLSRIWDAWTATRSPKSVVGILGAVARDLSGGFRRNSIWAPALALAVVGLSSASKWPRDFPELKFPVAMVRNHSERLASARVFTSDEWADYLIYCGWPRQKVFIDGRSDFYGPAIGKQYLQLANGLPDWERILNQYNFELVLIPPDWPLAALLKRHPGWRLAEEDSRAVLFEFSSLVPGPGLMRQQTSSDRPAGGPTR